MTVLRMINSSIKFVALHKHRLERLEIDLTIILNFQNLKFKTTWTKMLVQITAFLKKSK